MDIKAGMRGVGGAHSAARTSATTAASPTATPAEATSPAPSWAPKAGGSQPRPKAASTDGNPGRSAYQTEFNRVNPDQFSALEKKGSVQAWPSYVSATLPAVGKVILTAKGNDVVMSGQDGAERTLQPNEKAVLKRALEAFQQNDSKGGLTNLLLKANIVDASSANADYMRTRDGVNAFLQQL